MQASWWVTEHCMCSAGLSWCGMLYRNSSSLSTILSLLVLYVYSFCCTSFCFWLLEKLKHGTGIFTGQHKLLFLTNFILSWLKQCEPFISIYQLQLPWPLSHRHQNLMGIVVVECKQNLTCVILVRRQSNVTVKYSSIFKRKPKFDVSP